MAVRHVMAELGMPAGDCPRCSFQPVAAVYVWGVDEFTCGGVCRSGVGFVRSVRFVEPKDCRGPAARYVRRPQSGIIWLMILDGVGAQKIRCPA